MILDEEDIMIKYHCIFTFRIAQGRGIVRSGRSLPLEPEGRGTWGRNDGDVQDLRIFHHNLHSILQCISGRWRIFITELTDSGVDGAAPESEGGVARGSLALLRKGNMGGGVPLDGPSMAAGT